MKDFLGAFMKKHRFADKKTLNKFQDEFFRTITRIVMTLGSKPFHVTAGLNAAVFDSVMVAFSLTKKKISSAVSRRFKRLLLNDNYYFYISSGTTDVDVVRKRINLTRKVLFKD